MADDKDEITDFQSIFLECMKRGFDDTDEARVERGDFSMPDTEDFLSRLHEEPHFIMLCDIANFSTNDSRTQMIHIFRFQFYITLFAYGFGDDIRVRDFVSTGDGCYMIANACNPHVALDFLITMMSGARMIRDNKGDRVPIRVSALLGSCIPFIDCGGSKDFAGDGMNEAQRILSCGQHALEDELARGETPEGIDVHSLSANTLYLGDSLSDITPEQASRATRVFRFKDVPDKHGITRNITALEGIRPMKSDTFFRMRNEARDKVLRAIQAFEAGGAPAQ